MKTVPPQSPDGEPLVKLPGQRVMARQPILDEKNNVYGYELLFRDGFENYFRADREQAARSTLDSSLLFGLDTLCDGKLAFVNCTAEVLFKDLITLLPAQQTVIEILENEEIDDRVVAACQRLKSAGYLIALDDFLPDDPRCSIVHFADILKIDIRVTTEAQCADLVKKYGPHCRMLAEKVETQNEFRTCRAMGFKYFQGYYFRHPELMVAREVPASRVSQLRLLELVCHPELKMQELERAIKQEASVCYRLLRYLNSPLFGFALEIKSVGHAMTILGERELRRWIRLVVTVGMADQKCSELVLIALARAHFCESLSRHIRSESDLFLLGLMSMMDVVLEVPMSVILDQLPLDHETKAVLLGQPSKLRPLYQLMLAHESAEWEPATALAAQLHLSDAEVSDNWWKAMQWAQEVTGGM